MFNLKHNTMKRHWYTIEVSRNGLVWYIVGRHKFLEDARRNADEMEERGDWEGYTIRIGLH